MPINCEIEFEGVVDTFHGRLIKSAHPHRCEECGNTIPARTCHFSGAGVWEGEYFEVRACLDCVEISRNFGAHEPGALYEDIIEWARESGRDLPLHFFDGLSPKGVDLIQQHVLEWL